MRTKAAVLVVMVSLAAAGCGGPLVTVRHQFPSDLPIPEGPKFIRLAEFKVVTGPADSHGEYAAAELAERLRPMGECMTVAEFPAEGPDWPRLGVKAAIHIDAKDTEGERTIRRLEPKTEKSPAEEVPTLVRKVTVRVDFVVTDAAAGKQIAAVEGRTSYSSTEDPRTRGPKGLGRPDDPKNVLPTEDIVRELLTACVDSFFRMIRPPAETADVRLRRTFNRDGRKGIAAARKGNFHQALRHFEAAAKARPKNLNLLFNLAVTAEGAEELQAALKHYQALRKKRPDDPVIEEAIGRIQRVQARRKPGAAAKAPTSPAG